MAEAAPEHVVLSLTGDIHSRVAPGVPWDAGFEPMGLMVKRRLATRHVYGLGVAHPGHDGVLSVDTLEASAPAAG